MTLEAVSLSAGYGQRSVLREIAATIAPGRITAIVGPNAAGKTTLLRCLVGLIRPSSGCVRLDGRRVHTQRRRIVANRLAFAAQRTELAASFTVREVVALATYGRSGDPRRLDDAMDAMDVTALAGRPFSSLSVGQQQRVTLARTLAQIDDDGILVLDEPIASMDLRAARATLDVLQQRTRGGATVVVAMHDLALAAAAADDAWLLDAGRLVAAGPVADVCAPEVLAPVFGVPFERVLRGDGSEWLVPAVRTTDPVED